MKRFECNRKILLSFCREIVKILQHDKSAETNALQRGDHVVDIGRIELKLLLCCLRALGILLLALDLRAEAEKARGQRCQYLILPGYSLLLGLCDLKAGTLENVG